MPCAHYVGAGVNVHANIDRDTMGLIEKRSPIWRDVVFVNISGDADRFEMLHADRLKRWAGSGPDLPAS